MVFGICHASLPHVLKFKKGLDPVCILDVGGKKKAWKPGYPII